MNLGELRQVEISCSVMPRQRIRFLACLVKYKGSMNQSPTTVLRCPEFNCNITGVSKQACGVPVLRTEGYFGDGGIDYHEHNVIKII